MEGVLSGLTVIAIVVCLGYLVGRLGVIGSGAEDVLSRLTFFVATPALLFNTLARADVRSVLSSALLVMVVSTVSAVVVFALVAGALWRRSLAETIVGALASSYVNTVNLGIPVAVYVLGDVSYMVPVLLYQLVVVTPLAMAGRTDGLAGGAAQDRGAAGRRVRFRGFRARHERDRTTRRDGHRRAAHRPERVRLRRPPACRSRYAAVGTRSQACRPRTTP